MTIEGDDTAPDTLIAGKEPWETPRVVATSVKDNTTYYAPSDDTPHS